MKIRVTWDGNVESTSRVHSQSASSKLWVLVQDENGEPMSSDCTLRVIVRNTLFMSWAAGVLMLRCRKPSRQDSPNVARAEPKRSEFVVNRLPRRFFPYWLEIRAFRTDVDRDTLGIFVVPTLNRLLSFLFLALFALLLTYSSWLWLKLASEGLPKGLGSFAATGSAVLGPLVALAGPFFSVKVRRFVLDSLATGAAAAAALLLAVVLHRVQDPVYIENNTPGAMDVSGTKRHVLIESGTASVVPREELDDELRKYLSCRESKDETCAPPPNHWFKSGQYCIRNGDESAKTCLELRSASVLTQLQRWLSFGETIRIGCHSVKGLAPDAVTAWKKSASCAHDRSLGVKRSLQDHLVTSSMAKEQPKECDLPGGEVTLYPFRAPANPAGNASPIAPATLELHVPEDAQDDSLPSWKFTSDGPLGELHTTPARDGAGIPCKNAYPTICEHGRDQGCPAGLFVPRGEINATLEQGNAPLGKLWCGSHSKQVFAMRVMSRVVSLTVFESERRAVSQYTSTSEGTGAWVAWCEPGGDVTSRAGQRSEPPLEAEVVLPHDWQPVGTWKWSVPGSSRVGSIDLVLKDRGRWGTIGCDLETPGDRMLSLIELQNRRASAVKETFPDNKLGWMRYSESNLFPLWVWVCKGAGQYTLPPLLAKLEDGASGRLNARGVFDPSVGEPCEIDEVKLVRLSGRSGVIQPGPVPEALRHFPVAHCDPERSVLVPANTVRSNSAGAEP